LEEVAAPYLPVSLDSGPANSDVMGQMLDTSKFHIAVVTLLSLTLCYSCVPRRHFTITKRPQLSQLRAIHPQSKMGSVDEMWPYSCECGFRFKSFNALNRHKLNQCKLTLAQLDPPKDSRSMSLTTTMANKHYPANDTMKSVDEITHADRCECGRHFKNYQALQCHRNNFCKYTLAQREQGDAGHIAPTQHDKPAESWSKWHTFFNNHTGKPPEKNWPHHEEVEILAAARDSRISSPSSTTTLPSASPSLYEERSRVRSLTATCHVARSYIIAEAVSVRITLANPTASPGRPVKA
jgi:hypothetical protein